MQLCPVLRGAEAVRVALLRFLQLFSLPEGFRWRFPVHHNLIAAGGGQVEGLSVGNFFGFDGDPWWAYKRRGSLCCRSGCRKPERLVEGLLKGL